MSKDKAIEKALRPNLPKDFRVVVDSRSKGVFRVRLLHRSSFGWDCVGLCYITEEDIKRAQDSEELIRWMEFICPRNGEAIE